MPTYVYYCKVHGEFEEVHSISKQLEDCPKCIEESLEPQKITRLIAGGTTFVLNGTRWAKTNYS